jgi:hypothetical protein
MLVLAVDPGTTRSGWTLYSHASKRVISSGDKDNADVVWLISQYTRYPTQAKLVVEWFASHGQASMGAASMIDQYIRNGKRDDNLLRKAASMARTGATATGDITQAAMWLGMFIAAAGETPATVERLTRKEVLKAFHVASKGADSAIRAAIVDHFGGKDAIGTKAKPGPLHGVAGDAWAALAVALVYCAQADKDKAAIATIETAPF